MHSNYIALCFDTLTCAAYQKSIFQGEGPQKKKKNSCLSERGLVKQFSSWGRLKIETGTDTTTPSISLLCWYQYHGGESASK